MIDILRPSGNFLQIGFGKKNVASRCFAFHPQSYTLIEADPLKLEEVKNWMKKHPGVTLITDIWQTALLPLGIFDSIYCELTDITGLWPELTRIRYTDHDLESFCETAVKTAPEQLFRFLHELAHNGQITPEQLEKMVRRHKLTGSVPKMKKSCAQMIACLKMCLDRHMRKGSLFAAPLDDLATAYEDPAFAQIAVDPFVEIRDVGEGIVVEKFGP
jgi:hypothetical protein